MSDQASAVQFASGEIQERKGTAASILRYPIGVGRVPRMLRVQRALMAAVAAWAALATAACSVVPPGAISPPSARAAHSEDAAPQSAGAAPTPPLAFGTLLTEPRRAAAEYEAGVRLAHLELSWRRYEPERDAFDERYAAEQRERLRALQAAGMRVVLSVGLHYPPDWAGKYPNSRYVNQYGEDASDLNLTFNQPLRERAERYIAQVNRDLGLQNFWAISIGSGGLAEALYPSGQGWASANSFWAFDDNAQGTAQGGGRRPASIPASPYPGWRPGETSYAGQRFTPAQVEEWYDWYLAALTDGVTWQMDTYRALGYPGQFFVLMPGVGVRPPEYRAAIRDYLASDIVGGPVARGALWQRLVVRLRDRSGAVVYVSSVADGSGDDDVCRPDDTGADLNSGAVLNWSAARWLSALADRYGLPKAGENPGRRYSRRYGPEMLAAAARQARACGFQALFWAHDEDLYDPESGVGLQDLAEAAAGRESSGDFGLYGGE
jgi:hypothetical protein